ncbi:MAG: radical SAM protein [Candidatus Pacearchaeota archaeon]
MRVAKIIPEVFQEYKNEISLGICCALCNFRCSFCHSKGFIYDPDKWLKESVNNLLIDNLNPLHTAVVLSGGEPTVWGKDLIGLIEIIKSFKLKVKIFSNAFNCDIIAYCNEFKMVDMYSFDIKAAKDVKKVIESDISDDEYLYKISKSFDSCIEHNIPFEFRVTKYPGIEIEPIKEFLKKYPQIPIFWQDYVEYV